VRLLLDLSQSALPAKELQCNYSNPSLRSQQRDEQLKVVAF
jgi:hypothetical protein